MSKLKPCPYRVYGERRASLTISGEFYYNEYFMPCIEKDCACFHVDCNEAYCDRNGAYMKLGNLKDSDWVFEKAMEEMQTQIVEFPDSHQKFIFERKVEMDGDSIKIGDWEYQGVKTEKG